MNTRCTRATRLLLILLTAAGPLSTAGCTLSQRQPSAEAPAQEPLAPSHPSMIASQIAVSMIGVPYRYGGSSPQGFDCSGLVYYAYVNAGVPVPRTAADQHRQSRKIPPQQVRPGDLLFFDTSWRNGHVGIYVGDGEFVHAPSSGKRVSRASIKEGYFSKRLSKAGRLTEP